MAFRKLKSKLKCCFFSLHQGINLTFWEHLQLQIWRTMTAIDGMKLSDLGAFSIIGIYALEWEVKAKLTCTVLCLSILIYEMVTCSVQTIQNWEIFVLVINVFSYSRTLVHLHIMFLNPWNATSLLKQGLRYNNVSSRFSFMKSNLAFKNKMNLTAHVF